MDRRVTPPKRVTSPTWGPPPPCKQALSNLQGGKHCGEEKCYKKTEMLIMPETEHLQFTPKDNLFLLVLILIQLFDKCLCLFTPLQVLKHSYLVSLSVKKDRSLKNKKIRLSSTLLQIKRNSRS